MTFNGRERKVLKQLISDCGLYGLSEADSMEYVEVRYGRPISRLYYYKVKNLLNSDTFVDKCFNHFGNIRSCN